MGECAASMGADQFEAIGQHFTRALALSDKVASGDVKRQLKLYIHSSHLRCARQLSTDQELLVRRRVNAALAALGLVECPKCTEPPNGECDDQVNNETDSAVLQLEEDASESDDELEEDELRLQGELYGGETKMHLAARRGRLDAVKYYIEHQPTTIDSEDLCGYRPIHDAAKEGHASIVSALASAGASVRRPARGCPPGSGEAIEMITPLMSAAQFGRDECVKVLIKLGAPAEMKDAFVARSAVPRINTPDCQDDSDAIVDITASVCNKPSVSTVRRSKSPGRKSDNFIVNDDEFDFENLDEAIWHCAKSDKSVGNKRSHQTLNRSNSGSRKSVRSNEERNFGSMPSAKRVRQSRSPLSLGDKPRHRSPSIGNISSNSKASNSNSDVQGGKSPRCTVTVSFVNCEQPWTTKLAIERGALISSLQARCTAEFERRHGSRRAQIRLYEYYDESVSEGERIELAGTCAMHEVLQDAAYKVKAYIISTAPITLAERYKRQFTVENQPHLSLSNNSSAKPVTNWLLQLHAADAQPHGGRTLCMSDQAVSGLAGRQLLIALAGDATGISSLDLSSNTLCTGDLPSLLASVIIASCDTLRTVKLADCRLDGASLAQMAGVLAAENLHPKTQGYGTGDRVVRIETLDLSENPLGGSSDSLTSLAQLLTQLRLGLKHLDLSNCDLSDADFTAPGKAALKGSVPLLLQIICDGNQLSEENLILFNADTQ